MAAQRTSTNPIKPGAAGHAPHLASGESWSPTLSLPDWLTDRTCSSPVPAPSTPASVLAQLKASLDADRDATAPRSCPARSGSCCWTLNFDQGVPRSLDISMSLRTFALSEPSSTSPRSPSLLMGTKHTGCPSVSWPLLTGAGLSLADRPTTRSWPLTFGVGLVAARQGTFSPRAGSFAHSTSIRPLDLIDGTSRSGPEVDLWVVLDDVNEASKRSSLTMLVRTLKRLRSTPPPSADTERPLPNLLLECAGAWLQAAPDQVREVLIGALQQLRRAWTARINQLFLALPSTPLRASTEENATVITGHGPPRRSESPTASAVVSD